MGEERETTQVIRRLRAIADDGGPEALYGSALRLELLELVRMLETIDARYERQEREQPGDGPVDETPARVRRRPPGGRPSVRRPDADA
jgi:hypothetical protein